MATSAPGGEPQVIRGIVFDSSGATLPGASIVVVDGTGAEHRLTGDSSGNFEVRLAAPPPFTVMVTAPGFAAHVVTLDAITDVLTIALGPAHVEEQVTVSSTLGRDSLVSSATKTATPLLQVPQSIDVVDAAVLQSQAATSMQDAMRNVAGVNANLGEGRRDQFLIRGFNAQNDTLVDGTRDDAPYYRDLATVDRIEVVKGPAAALFGRGSSGGVINRITKVPVREQNVSDFSAALGSLGARRATVDVGRRWRSDRWAFRLIAAAEDSTSFRHSFFLRRGTVAPSVLWSSDATSVLSQFEYLRDHRLPDRGIPSIDGRPANVRIAENYGYPADDSIDTTVIAATVRVEHRLRDGVLLRNVVRKGAYDTTFSNTAPSGTRQVNEEWRVLRQQYNVAQSQNNLFNQSEVLITLAPGPATHAILAGVELGAQSRRQQRFNGTVAEVALINPVLTQPQYAATPAAHTAFDGWTAAFYVQDQIGFSDRWKALLGVRGDRYRQTLDDLTASNVDLARTDVNWSPRAGLVFQPTASTSVYTSVSRSFQPSGESLSLAANAAELKPEISRNIEVGTKASLFGGRATAAAAMFRLDRTNIKTTDPIDPVRLVLVGRQRTDGVELAFDGRVTGRLTGHASYAWLDATVLRSNSVISGVPIEGNRPGLVPRHAFNLWAGYELTSRWSAGGGVTTTGDRFVANDNVVTLPEYARVDATMRYAVGLCEFAVNARNLLNRTYFETASSNFQIYPGTPRELVLTFRLSL